MSHRAFIQKTAMLALVCATFAAAGVARAAAPDPEGQAASEIDSGQIVQPFAVEVAIDGYWLTRLKSRPQNAAMRAFRDWLLDAFSTGLGIRNGR